MYCEKLQKEKQPPPPLTYFSTTPLPFQEVNILDSSVSPVISVFLEISYCSLCLHVWWPELAWQVLCGLCHTLAQWL
jgi:hypothetical protein